MLKICNPLCVKLLHGWDLKQSLPAYWRSDSKVYESLLLNLQNNLLLDGVAKFCDNVAEKLLDHAI